MLAFVAIVGGISPRSAAEEVIGIKILGGDESLGVENDYEEGKAEFKTRTAHLDHRYDTMDAAFSILGNFTA